MGVLFWRRRSFLVSFYVVLVSSELFPHGGHPQIRIYTYNLLQFLIERDLAVTFIHCGCGFLNGRFSAAAVQIFAEVGHEVR